MEKFLKVTVNGTVYDVKVEEVKPGEIKSEEKVPTQIPESKPTVEQPKPIENKVSPSAGNIKVLAPMPGNIWKIKTSIGAKVEKHEVLLILEAMKMENEVVAQKSGSVKNIFVDLDSAVVANQALMLIE